MATPSPFTVPQIPTPIQTAGLVRPLIQPQTTLPATSMTPALTMPSFSLPHMSAWPPCPYPWGAPVTPAAGTLPVPSSSPFVKEVMEYEIPTTSKLPTLKTYNGTTDPDSHIDSYEWHMTSLKLDERFWCTYFPTTLDGNAGAWFKSLEPNSISNFAQLKQSFLTNFMQLRRYRGDNHAILGCKQREGETLKDYFARFNKATLDVPGQDDRLVTGAFTWGLLPGPLSTKFLGKPPQSRLELKERVERFLRQEEGNAEKSAYFRASATNRRGEGSAYYSTRPDQGHPGRKDTRQRRFQPFYRGGGRGHVNVVGGRGGPRDKQTRPKFCEYHQSKTHSTQECLMLRREVEEKQLKGNIVEIARTLRANLGIPQGASLPPKEEPRNVFTIRSRSRMHNRRPVTTGTHSPLDLSFSVTDPRPPHWQGDDPLVIAGYIHDWRIWRIYVDTGSAADIIYEHCF